MKYRLLYILLVFTLITGCDSVRIFSPVEQTQRVVDPATHEVLINASVVSSPDHPWQYLEIYNDGVTVVGGHRLYVEKTGCLSSQELHSLRDQFVQNDFMQMPNLLMDKYNAAPLAFVITFHSDGKSNQVRTNDLLNNAGLAQIVAALDAVVDRVVHDGLELTLTVSPTTLHANERATCQLTVHNAGTANIQLAFQSDRLYRFYAYRYYRFAAAPGAVPDDWISAGQEVLTGVEQGVLRAGESVSFTQTWDGKNEQGLRLQGEVAIVAELLTVPGGITAETIIKVE